MLLKKLSAMGLKSDHLYTAGFVSVGMSIVTWTISEKKPGDSKAQADRWGVFVGEWAPTFFALGVALKLEENSHSLTG